MARNRILTEEMVFQRTKCNRMDLIRNLNLWGNDLSEIGALRHMPNLEVLSLSVNQIETLIDIRSCPKLTELYLRKNAVSDLSEVRHLRALKKLKVLWLSDNPCAELPQYRLYVLHQLPSLVKLDSSDVTEEERRQATQVDVDQMQTHVERDFEPQVAQGRWRGEPPELTRRFSAPADHQEDVALRRSGGSRSAHGSPANYYEDQHVDHRDFHLPPPGQNHHGYLDRAPPLDAMNDDHSPDRSPSNGHLESPHCGYMMEPSNGSRPALRRGSSEVHRSADVGMERHRVAPRCAWDSPEIAGKERHGNGGESSNGDIRSRISGSPGDRGGQGDAHMHSREQAGFDQMDTFGMTATNGRNAARADNILCAVLALIKELDQQGLELVRRAIEQRQSEA